jgi:uroporphyrin-III C-methyltransferase/precorrin-2 dehydrogenase/sirohydrochlorin ferrochelatase
MSGQDLATSGYPLLLDLTGRPVLVVGGGPVAARRARGLVDAGASVTVVSPWACEDIVDLAGSHRLRWLPREYADGDVDGMWLVHTATGDPLVDARAGAAATRARVWFVDAGDASRSAAWTPAVAKSDGVTIAVSGGGDPRRAVRVRDAVAATLASGALPTRPVRPATSRIGSVALVGGGPAGVDLMTTRGRRLVALADVLVIDRLAPREILSELADDVLVVDVGKTPGHHPVPQETINELLVTHARAGRRVVRLKGGDPYVLGRGGEEVAACRAAGIEVEVVPGVTSAIAVPAAVGIPVTHRGVARAFTVATGHDDLADVPVAPDHTLVLLMGVAGLRRTTALLVSRGLPPTTPVAIIEDGFGPRQRATFSTIIAIADEAERVGLRAPAVTIIGDVVRLAPQWPR